ncbi:MAG: FlgD immunoglobulin-like domain containing protein, partial [Candidatus Tenebribacter davisii]|nr:FlgD immunoglobulin-like domain containing protein [Candidatus Tenebribacter davisii]
QAYCYHGVCALWLDNLIYKSFYTSFDLSQFTDGNDIEMIITDAMEWFNVEIVTNDNVVQTVPKIVLEQNYPNPFNPTTTISFSIAQTSSYVTLNIYNIKGQKVKSLLNEKLDACTHQVMWDGKDENGKSATSGIYFYKLQTESFSKTNKMLMVK